MNYLDRALGFDRSTTCVLAMLRTRRMVCFNDGGKDQSPAVQVVWFGRLNVEIETQVTRVEPNPAKPSFQLYAVRKWNALHATDIGHQNVFARALENNNGKPVWKADASPDQQLLPLLNRYCFRCHSSLKYSVFDRDAVVSKKNRASSS